MDYQDIESPIKKKTKVMQNFNLFETLDSENYSFESTFIETKVKLNEVNIIDSPF